MSNPTINIIIADDHQLFVDGLRLVLAADPSLYIMDVANDGQELMDILQKTTPDLLLLDINMPKMNGLEATRYIRQKYSDLKIVMLSTYSDEHLILKSKELGANGYLLKNSNKEELLNTIRKVIDGEQMFYNMVNTPSNDFSQKDDFLKQFHLTPREMEIVLLIKDNLTNAEIAQKLFLSIYTIETHRKNIMQKLGIKKPAALMKFIIEHNL